MARIRSFKPELLRHPVIGRLPEFDFKVLMSSIAAADDEGYFRADAHIFRGDVMPFEDNLQSITESLRRLSEIGWITIAEHAEQGKIARISKWTTHQKISHPSQSKIKVYFDSGNTPEILQKPPELFRSEQGAGSRDRSREQGTGSSEQGQEQHPPTPLVNEGGVKKTVETVEKPKTRPTPGMDFWSVVMVNLKDELSSQSLRGTAFKLPYEYDTLFRDTWQSRVEDGVLYVGSEDPERTAGALKKYAKRLDDIFDRKFHCKVRFEAEAAVTAEVAQ